MGKQWSWLIPNRFQAKSEQTAFFWVFQHHKSSSFSTLSVATMAEVDRKLVSLDLSFKCSFVFNIFKNVFSCLCTCKNYLLQHFMNSWQNKIVTIHIFFRKSHFRGKSIVPEFGCIFLAPLNDKYFLRPIGRTIVRRFLSHKLRTQRLKIDATEKKSITCAKNRLHRCSVLKFAKNR